MLIVLLGICTITISIAGYIIHRADLVHQYRMKMLKENWKKYQEMPAYEEMMWYQFFKLDWETDKENCVERFANKTKSLFGNIFNKVKTTVVG